MDERDWSNSLTTSAPTYYYKYGESLPASMDQWGLAGDRSDRMPQMTSAGTTTYSGPGGTFSRPVNPNIGRMDPNTGRRIEADTSMGGTWTSGQGGPQITNMPGYLGMKEQQQAGSDFSMYGSRLKDLMSDPSKITETPGYKFAVGQGTQAINRSAAARGQLGGGGVLAELAKYGQGMASQEYGNEVNRLSGLMGQAQQFGLSSGYYKPEQYTPGLGVQGAGTGGGGGASSSGALPIGTSLGGTGGNTSAGDQNWRFTPETSYADKLRKSWGETV